MWPFFLLSVHKLVFIRRNRFKRKGSKRIMKFTESLKKSKDFQHTYRRGLLKANKLLVMYVRKNSLEKNRIGISVSKKVGNSVNRHRLTRLIRESYRVSEDFFICGIDIIIVVRPIAKDSGYHQIRSALLHLGKLHHIYMD